MMKSNCDPCSSRPPRAPKADNGAPKANGGGDAAAEARRLNRSRLLDSFHRKQEMLRLERTGRTSRHLSPAGGSRRSQSSASFSDATSTIVTRSKTKQQEKDSDSFRLLSPDKFQAYREEIGYVAPIPVSTVNLTAKSPASTIGGCSLSSSAPLLSPTEEAVDVDYTVAESQSVDSAEAESALKFFDKNSTTITKENVVNKSSTKKKKKERSQPSTDHVGICKGGEKEMFEPSIPYTKR